MSARGGEARVPHGYSPGLNACKREDWARIVYIQFTYRPAHLLRVLEGHHGQCAKCSVGILGTGLAYDVHPIRPVSLGVKSNYLNLALLCKKCHYRISAAMSRGETDVIAKYECQGLIDLPLSDPAD